MIEGLLLKLLRLGISPKDNQNIRAQKKALNYMFITISVSGILWSIMYLSLGFYISSLFPLFFPLALLVFLRKYQHNQSLDYAVNILLWEIYLLPIFLQLSIGGFSDSGAVIAWSFCAPIGALLFKTPETAIKWFLAFLFSIVTIAGIQVFSPYTIYTPSDWIVTLFYVMNLGMVMIISFSAVLYFSKNLKKANMQIINKSIELNKSIATASVIQKSIIGDPNDNPEFMKENNFFIYCKPREIVCGDFLWTRHLDDKQILIVADSSHNGVPGALLTILGNNALNEIILNNGVMEAGKIIDAFLDYFSNSTEINKNSKTKNLISKHQLNLGVLIIDHQISKITYAGLNNTMVQVIPNAQDPESNQLLEYIGDEVNTFKDKTTSFSVQFTQGSMIYLSTNGFAKQLDSIGVRAFKHKKFCDLVSSMAHLEFEEQEKALEERLNHWKGDQPLTEDVLVLGIKV